MLSKANALHRLIDGQSRNLDGWILAIPIVHISDQTLVTITRYDLATDQGDISDDLARFDSKCSVGASKTLLLVLECMLLKESL